ncbi:type III-A CRISPR-associated protein Cas10/Csm1 [Candidatus Poribacteria bacterium]|nr:type III-A CRISPR-associated protein Cas10/Csm1 [Candidatus Poribacteria bacterium]
MDGDTQRQYQTVVLGALLHDVGKYIHRARDASIAAATSGTHQRVGARFVSEYQEYFARCADVDLLADMVQHHHSPSDVTDSARRLLVELVQQADHIASTDREQRTGERWSWRTTAVAPLLRRVRFTDTDVPADLEMHVPVSCLGETNANGTMVEPPVLPLPGRCTEQGDVNEHVLLFGRTFETIVDTLPWGDFRTVLTHLLALLGRFAHCLPADTQLPVPDVSLFDHMRVTAAIAACLYRYHVATATLNPRDMGRADDRARCQLVAGDLSGIQGYLYGIASPAGVGGVAKRLRARSFWLQMLVDAASQWLLDELNLSGVNLLVSSGGKFYILAPNTDDATATVDRIREECDAWFLKNYHGALSLNLACSRVCDNELGVSRDGRFGYSAALRRAANELRAVKARRLRGALVDRAGWREQPFIRDPYGAEESACRSCGRFPARYAAEEDSTELVLCDACETDRQRGEELVDADYIAFETLPSSEKRHDTILGLWRLRAVPRGSQPPQADWVVRLNNADLSECLTSRAGFRYLARHVPSDGRTVKDFEEIAGQGGRLAVIKADVDNLGLIFQEGLKRDAGEGLDSPSRLAAMSRQLDTFFAGWVEWLIQTQYPDAAYTVYSGGDDLLLVVRRDDALRLIGTIRDTFNRMCQNPELTLSAGISVIHSHLPLPQAVGAADDALSSAKEGSKNRLCALGTVLPWDDLSLVESAAELLESVDANGRPRLPTSFLYQLLEFGRMWQRWRERRNAHDLRWQPMLAYQCARNLRDASVRDIRDWLADLVAFPVGDDSGEDDRFLDARKTMDYMPLIAQWALYGRREDRDVPEAF